MLKNYLTTAFRSLTKHKAFTAINMTGLSIGLATCLSIILYVADELSYDRYNANADRIVRVNLIARFGGTDQSYAGMPAPAARDIKSELPEVENTTRLAMAKLWHPEGFHVKKGDQIIQEDNIAWADPSLFSLFTLPMTQGNANTALVDPHSVVITESTARKYFGRTTNIVGQTLTFDDTITNIITGVIKDIPKQSHFNFDIFLAMSSLPSSKDLYWGGGGINTYLLLRPGTNYKNLEPRISGMAMKKAEGLYDGGVAAFEKSGNRIRADLTPLTDIHLHSNRQQETGRNGNSQYVFIFSAIAILILLIACVNFMNLSTARSQKRAREVGVRKVLGSGRIGLITQFLTESMIVTAISTILALLITWLTLPLFNQLADKDLHFTTQTLTWLIPSAAALIIIVGLGSGSYPAFILSAFRPIDVLKAKFFKTNKGGSFRSLLVVFQFSISIFLIIGTLVIYTQLHYIQTRNLGYDRSQVLTIKNTTPLDTKADILKQKLQQINGVTSATLSNFLPTGEKRNRTALLPTSVYDQKKAIILESWPVDEDYITTLGMQLKSGRNFSKQMATDDSAIILNESAARLFAINSPENQLLYHFPYDRPTQQYHVIGIIKDFNFNSLRENVTPLALRRGASYGALTLRVTTDNLPTLIAQIKTAWTSVASGQQLEYSFMDADFNATYRSEQRVGTICFVFTALAIGIACLGIFGLAAYAAERRSKEIGIRKVLGATVPTIFRMLSTDFIKLVAIAIGIATPLAWFSMQKWLQEFAYRATIPWWILAIGGVTAMAIALFSVSFQAVKAATANPADSLRAE
jgi:putative ABC transport system permease protein